MQEYGVGIFKLISTKSALKKVLKKNCITVDTVIATSATFIRGGECIVLSILEESIDKKKFEFALTVLFEDDVVKSASSKRFGKLNLVQLEPITGRRHQLRKHLLSMGNPILGDATYGIEHLVLKGRGLYLHAYSLEFNHPFTKEKMYIKDELPQKFKKIVI